MSRPSRRSLFVLSFVLLLAPLLVSAQDDSIAATAVEPAAVAPSKRLVLTVDAPAGPLALGDEAALTIVVANPMAETVENVLLYLPQARGVEWIEPADGGWVALGALAAGESRTVAARLRVGAMPRSGYLRFFVGATGDDAKPARERFDLLVPRANAETATVPAVGSEVSFANGRVRLVFPLGWNEQDAQLTFQLEELYKHKNRERGRLLLFTLTATAGGTPVESFDAPVAVTLALSDLKSDDPTAPAPTVSTAPTADENWTTVESDFDPAAGTLAFNTTELAAVQAATDPELWRLDYNPPGASAYSGAATYSYPIELPPGIGGLTPDLTLSYSSRAAEGHTYPAMSQGFGAGWGLPQAQINNGSSGRMYMDDLGGSQGNTDFDKNAFTLVLNGMNYYMNPLSTAGRYGTYKAIGSPELFILYAADLSIPNVSGEYWLVRTADGTTYTFGRTEDAEQVIWPVEEARNTAQPRNDRFSPYNWKLNSIVDVHGNRVEYVYDTACGKIANGSQDRGQNRQDEGHVGEFECSEVDTAVKEIRYNFSGGAAKTVIRFNNEQVNGAVRSQKLSMTAGVLRPTQIQVIQDGKTDPPLSTYTFFYTGGSHGFDPWLVSTQFWMLTHIYHSGSDGTTLPAQQFSYSRDFTHGCSDDGSSCVKLLTQVDNGYGGVTVLGYQTYRDWEVVQYTETWDGVVHRRGTDGKGQTRVEYDHTGATACFDSAGSACHMGTQHPTEALVGFNQATITTLGRNGANWATLNKTALTFYNNDYWLLGRTQYEKQYESDGKQLAQAQYEWEQLSGFVYLEWEAHALFDATNGQTSVGSTTVYTYYPVDPANGQYGGLKQKIEKDETTPGAVYRCTEYAYVHRAGEWLINRPARETVKSGGCAGTKVAETLYRYADSNKPAVVGLDGQARLTYVLRWLKQGNNDRYVVEQRTYTAQGLPEMVATFTDVLALDAANYDDLVTRNWTTTTYTANNLGLPETITIRATDVAEQTQTIGYNTTFPWLVASMTDANGIVTRYGYDGFGRLSKVALPGDTLDAPTLTYAYSDGPAPWKVETSTKNTARSKERAYYDGLGRVVQTQIDNANVDSLGVRDLVTSVAYDARGLEVCRGVPYDVAPSANAFQTTKCADKPHTTTTYDALGRARSVTTPDGATARTDYEVATNVTVDGHSLFLRTAAYDGNSHLTTRFSDVFGRLVMVREFTGNTWTDGAPTEYAAYADTRYNYNVLDNLTAVRASAASDAAPTTLLRVTTMAYDTLGRKTTMSDQDMGAWTYAYDVAGNLIWQKDSSSNAICFYYDGLNRLVQRQKDNDAGNQACPAKMDWDNWPATDRHLASYVYGEAGDVGRLKRVYWGTAPQQNNDSFYYDAEGRLAWQYRQVNGQNFAYGLTDYDVLDQPWTLYPPSGESVAIEYDQEGANTLTAGGTTLIDAIGYNERGQLTLLSRANGAPDTTLLYHGAGSNFRLNKILHGGEGGALPDFIYGAAQYDPAGNLLGMQMKVNAATESYSFGYDALNRLTTANLTGAGTANYSYTYSYNELGNITSRTGTDPDLLTYGYGNRAASGQIPAMTGGPQAVTYVDVSGTANDWRYDYDARGNLDGKYAGTTLTHDYTFDVEGRLASVRTSNQTTTFLYDADGQRVMTSRPDGVVVYTPFPDYEREVAAGGAVTERTTYSIAGQMVAVRSAGTLYYTYGDHLGSVVAMSWLGGTYRDGSLARYDPFGNYRTWPGSNVNPLILDRGFTGHVHDNTGPYPTQNVGLIYMNARYYLPEIGRFVSADSIVPEPGNPQSYNRYAYTLNNPVNFTDPTGHMESNGCERGESCQPLANPWQLTESLLDKDQNGVVPDREISREMDRLESSSATTLLTGAVSPVDSSLNPFGGPMTSTDCDRETRPPCDARHPAVDSWTDATNRYDPVYAIAPGKVVAVGNATDGFGNYVIIEHNVYGTLYYSVYAHNARWYVAVGDVVIAGTAIASMGDTNTQAIVHSHFEIRTLNNISLDQSNPFTGHVYWPTTASSLATNFIDLGPIYGYEDTYNTWAEANP